MADNADPLEYEILCSITGLVFVAIFSKLPLGNKEKDKIMWPNTETLAKDDLITLPGLTRALLDSTDSHYQSLRSWVHYVKFDVTANASTFRKMLW